jgi:hypothetical protein
MTPGQLRAKIVAERAAWIRRMVAFLSPAGLRGRNSVERLRSLGPALQQCSGVLFAYLFGGATVSPLKPLSNVDVAVYLLERTAELHQKSGEEWM